MEDNLHPLIWADYKRVFGMFNKQRCPHCGETNWKIDGVCRDEINGLWRSHQTCNECQNSYNIGTSIGA